MNRLRVPTIGDGLEFVRKQNRCGLCGREPISITGVFYPNEDLQKRLGVENGAGFFYGLCVDCIERPDHEPLIEDRIINQYQVQ